ncbi:hypothetical protein JD844_034175, partial [Phrynosoma platyrhinos]
INVCGTNIILLLGFSLPVQTDPENTDYAMEHGATRNFQAEKLLEEEEKRLQKEREDEELNNPMKVLENRTKDSKLEMEILENLQELKELNQRQAHPCLPPIPPLHHNGSLKFLLLFFIPRQMLEQAQSRRLLEDSDSDEDRIPAPAKTLPKAKPTDILQEPQAKKLKVESWERSVGKLSHKAKLSGLVTAKKKSAGSIANGTASQEVSSGPGDGGKQGVGNGSLNTGNSSRDATMSSRLNTGPSSLSLLGAYSDSEDSKSD